MEHVKRVEWIDTAKFICITFVILSHLETNTSFWNAFYSPFFLTAFFFASGYVYKSGQKFLYKKFRQLFIPWLVFSTFNLLLSQIISFNSHGNFANELMWNLLQIRGKGDGVWFVACLFVTFIPFYFFIEWYENKWGGTVLLIVITFALSLISHIYTRVMPVDILPWKSVSLPWHLEYIFQAMFYIVLGYVFKRKLEVYFNEKSSLFTANIICVIYIVLVYVPYFFFTQTSKESSAYSYLCEIVGIVFIVSISKVFKSNQFIRYIGQNTLICFALHGKVYSLLETIMRRLIPSIYETILNNIVLSSVIAIVLATIITAILIVPVWVINRWFPYIIGRQNKKN